ncbi:G2/mitotic-specific cyclin-B3 [Phymastichus coffea]|uniref:G2/mitotic-specific cyclin-B3 n=1 Tax=Phymastichus coffea TaxID=108790 RepID=UPI00273B3DA8|nr:G2/mitotic-specific cyclin-B3 [Phymastichus coffea]
MPPSKILNAHAKATTTNTISGVVTRRGLATRHTNSNINAPVQVQIQVQKSQPILFKDTRIKRKADASPLKDKVAKRSALGNITNAIGKTIGVQIHDTKRVTKKFAVNHQHIKTVGQTTNIVKPLDKILPKQDNHIHGKQKQSQQQHIARIKPSTKKEEDIKIEAQNKAVINLRRSVETEKSDESSLYVSALESLSEENAKRLSRTNKEQEKKTTAGNKQAVPPVQEESTAPTTRNPIPNRVLPAGVQWDFDVENWNDPYQVSHYAMDIFQYLKDRERLFPVTDYMERQVCLSRWMRALLVDWMVAVQESFELNHETLYLAVKLVDLYLTKVTVGKETLQLLGAASLFIASKYDERIPPMIEDFLYICDGAYNSKDLVRMEISILKVMDFDLGIPLSYRFLRRYARCAKVSMPTLTLARYILEYSLMDYATISLSDSKMAATALFIALQMKELGGWTPTLEYYTGYKLVDFKDVVLIVNENLLRKHKDALATVRNKYTHKIFFEVAKVPLKEHLDL